MLNTGQTVQQFWDIATEARQSADWATAVTYYQRINELQPQRTDVLCELGKIFRQQQQPALAVRAYQQAIDIDPAQPGWVYEHLGKALQQLGDEPAAIAAYQNALKRSEPNLLHLYRDLAELLVKQKQYDRAIASYRQFIELKPSLASSGWTEIGNIYTRQERFFAAKAAYQQANRARALYHVNDLINSLRHSIGLADPFAIDILDNGCDPTGRQLALLAEYTTGRVVGTNIYSGFPERTVKYRRANNEFYYMDGQHLALDDSSFDLVISLNVLEHVPSPAKYLQECYRVMRPGGWGFFSWYPLWSGATGHHVHPDMVSSKARELNLEVPAYSLDGTSIPFWGHLLLSAQEMLTYLIEAKQYDRELAEWMRDYIYYGKDLNRWFWRDVWRSCQTLDWQIIEVLHRGIKPLDCQTQTRLQQKYGFADHFQISGAKIIVRK